MIKIRFDNNTGGGERSQEQLEKEVSLASFFMNKFGPSAKPEEYRIRVNREEVTADCLAATALNEGDRVSVSPAKVAGA